MKRILSFVMLLAVSSVFGATIASAAGFDALVGAITVPAAGFISAAVGGFMPAGVLGAGVFTEVWTGYLNKAFKLTEEAVGWYKRIKSYDSKVENDVIHFVNIGGKPAVLVNNTTYPIGISDAKDADKPIGLDKYQTERTVITDDELHAISYDKMGTSVELHKEAIEEKKFAKALHALAPNEGKTGAPVVVTSGEVDAEEGRKVFTRKDLLKLKKAFDKLKVPASQRVLVLCPDHVNDLLALDQNFQKQYYEHESGKITRMNSFDIYEFTDCPYFDVTTGKKVPFGAVVDDAKHRMASVAFADSKCMRADGSAKMYWRKAENAPDTQASEINFRKYSICLPLGEDCIGAIYSAKAQA